MASSRDKSKRLSAGKPEQLRLDDFVLYLDENLDNCKPILQVLVDHAVRFERHADRFQRGEHDEVWLNGSAQESGGPRDFGGFGVLDGEESSSRRCCGNVGTRVWCGVPSAEG